MYVNDFVYQRKKKGKLRVKLHDAPPKKVLPHSLAVAKLDPLWSKCFQSKKEDAQKVSSELPLRGWYNAGERIIRAAS